MGMAKRNVDLNLEFLRNDVVGAEAYFSTPFGDRPIIYGDYTASGRCVYFVENYLMKIQEAYANTHTEDDVTGRNTTELLHQAEELIKNSANAGEEVSLLPVGTGATGAIYRFQQILGLHLPPATKARMKELQIKCCGEDQNKKSLLKEFEDYQLDNRPVVFIGPYEHHSNEITWRECLCEVVTIKLSAEGKICLEDLKTKLADEKYQGRLKIGSFSAASNVTGIISPVYEIARLLHQHGALACFDFAASAPYVEINMNKDKESYFDAVFYSPHKFVGGPGSCGVLLFRKELYQSNLAPTCSGGGTVSYVNPTEHDYIDEIEVREGAGTPGTLQIMKAALATEIKDQIGIQVITEIEHKFLTKAINTLNDHKSIEFLGKPDPREQIGILSFNIKNGASYLHPKFITRLLNDLFGIQSRAGCSCAGPYGHYLLNIDDEKSEQYRQKIAKGYTAIKPGWVRIGFHYTMSEEVFNYICEALLFLADFGDRFLDLYEMDMETGSWSHQDDKKYVKECFSLQEALNHYELRKLCDELLPKSIPFKDYLNFAKELAEQIKGNEDSKELSLPSEVEELRYFKVHHIRSKNP